MSIGEIASRAGVSRRMLRHWEREGLLVPALVDPGNGYRRYYGSQLGRVRAIAELRDLGFSLGEIRRLLDPRIAQSGLEELLSRQANVLREQIAVASTRLAKIRLRLDAIREASEEIAMNLSIESLPALTLRGASATVLDETGIGQAVARLRRGLGRIEEDLVLLFDGTREDRIVVSVGIARPGPGRSLQEIRTAAVERGVSVRFDTTPDSIADAWVLIDAELEKRQLTAGGVYRQILAPNGATTLQAPVRTSPVCHVGRSLP